MEPRDSYGTTIAKAFGKTVFDKLFTWGLPVVMAASGVAAKLTAPGVLQNGLVTLAILSAVAFAVVIYVNHRFTLLWNRMDRHDEHRSFLNQHIGDEVQKVQLGIRLKGDELMRYMQLLANMHHYGYAQSLSTSGGVFSGMTNERALAARNQEREAMVQWLMDDYHDLSTAQAQQFVNTFYKPIRENVGH